MAKAFSFIIQNDFFHHLKHLKEFEKEWPIKLHSIEFGKIHKIRNLLHEHGQNVSERVFSGFYHHLFNDKLPIRAKFDLMMGMCQNQFVNKECVEEFLNHFQRYQKVYRGFCRLAYVYKLKRAKHEVVQDLCLNDLDTTSPNVLTLLLDKHKYSYSLTDVVNIFQSSITKMCYMIAIPIPVKNPYTNNDFSLTSLYNMYFFLKKRLMRVPHLIEGFFRQNFDISSFMMLYDIQIQDFALENYVKTSPYLYLLEGMYSMINEYTLINQQVNIHPQFPEKQLYDILKPYMVNYYKSKYSRTGELNKYHSSILKKKLTNFFIYNPKFGTIKSISKQGNITFDSHHIPPRKSAMFSPVTSLNDSIEVIRDTSLGYYRNRRNLNSLTDLSDMSLDSNSTDENESVIV